MRQDLMDHNLIAESMYLTQVATPLVQGKDDSNWILHKGVFIIYNSQKVKCCTCIALHMLNINEAKKMKTFWSIQAVSSTLTRSHL